jgi:hypothetical protein
VVGHLCGGNVYVLARSICMHAPRKHVKKIFVSL